METLGSSAGVVSAHHHADERQNPAGAKQQGCYFAHTPTTATPSATDLADGVDGVCTLVDGPPNLPIAHLMTMANNHWFLPWLRSAQ